MDNQRLNEIWPGWQLGKKLGQGSFGTVYKVSYQEDGIKTHAAIKEISITSDLVETDSLSFADQDRSRAYLQEIKLDIQREIELMHSMKGLQNVVSVEAFRILEKRDELGWDIYIRMELLTPFSEYVRGRALSESEVIRLGRDMCSALEICGKRGVIHRDIKPENIFVNQDGYFKLGDFGVARRMENLTRGMSQKGTPNYMAPEVYHGSTTYDARVDIYSLGLVLYRLMNGNCLPFLNMQQMMSPSEHQRALDRRLRGETLPPPSHASKALSAVILRACSYDSADRFDTVEDMKRALEQAERGELPPVPKNRPKPEPPKGPRPVPKKNPGDTQLVNRPKGGEKVPPDKPRTSDETDRRKSKPSVPPKLIAGALAAALVVGGGAFMLSGLTGGGDSGSSSGTETQYSRKERKEIDAIVSEAETLEEENRYEEAMDKVESGLVTYPESDKLQTERDEIAALIEEQVREEVISQVDALAAENRYEEAMTKVQEGLVTYPESAELQAKGNEIVGIITAQTMEQADALADSGSYPAAIALLENTRSSGLGVDFSNEIQQYQDRHVASVLETADALAAQGSYDPARKVLKEAAAIYPLRTELSEKGAQIDALEQQADALVEQNNPNQNPTPIRDGLDVTAAGGRSSSQAVLIEREDKNHDSVSKDDRVRWYRFVTSDNYSAYELALTNNSISMNSVTERIEMTVYNTAGEALGSEGIGALGHTAYTTLNLQANTEYLIKVNLICYGERSGGYTLSVNERICDAGRTQDEAFQIRLGKTYTKAMDTRWHAWYKFKTTANDATYRITETNNSVNAQQVLRVYDEYGTEMGMIKATAGGKAVMDLILEPEKEYTIRAACNEERAFGNYQFTVLEMLRDAGLTEEDAVPLLVGHPHQGTLETSFPEWYSYTITESGEYTLELTNHNVDGKVYATVYDLLGTNLGTLAAGNSSTRSETMPMEAGTVLRVKVVSEGIYATGNYTLAASKG